jgi:chromate reductase, NAD(P)H dehydrogenase (quinone)
LTPVPRILVFPGSLRTGSHNARLAGTIVKSLALKQCEVTRIMLRDYPLPIYDGNLEMQSGAPGNAKVLARLFHEHDAVIIVAPEYNASSAPLVKNTIDWISRVKADADGKPVPYKNRIFGLASASSGKFAGVRGLYHLRATLMNVGAQIVTEQLSIAYAQNAFDDMDDLKDEQDRKRMDNLVDAVIEKASLYSTRL